MAKSASKKTKKQKLSSSERAFRKTQRDHRSAIRSIFRLAGFARIDSLADKEFTFDNQTTDFDDFFLFENILIAAEYTCSKESSVGDHLKKKKIVYDKILNQPQAFISFLKQRFPDSAGYLNIPYHLTKIILRVVYCSRFDFDSHYKVNVPGPVYLDYPAVRYFASVSEAVKMSCRFELMEFLQIKPQEIGQGGKISISAPSREYQGSILPEAHSNFDEGFKVVSFYADPDALLRTAYVLRKDGWKDTLNLYQRMISKSKVEAIRSYLKAQKRVFINNIIVTLPSDVKPLKPDGHTIDTSLLTETEPAIIKLPDRPNSIGLIDGQHRVFAYYESIDDDTEIAQLRVQQNLLITGIIYPKDTSSIDREKFEARLFLEINSNQSTAKSQLKQAIGLVLEPYSSESIAARVLSKLARTGPLSGHIEQYFFDKGKLKTSSIVSYGLKPLVKTSGDDSLFAIWNDASKAQVKEEKNSDALDRYVSFCTSTISQMLSAVKHNLPAEKWTTDSKIPGRVLTTTYVNSFLIALRLLITDNKDVTFEALNKGLNGINNFKFDAYHSSQYARMAGKIVELHFP